MRFSSRRIEGEKNRSFRPEELHINSFYGDRKYIAVVEKEVSHYYTALSCHHIYAYIRKIFNILKLIGLNLFLTH